LPMMTTNDLVSSRSVPSLSHVFMSS